MHNLFSASGNLSKGVTPGLTSDGSCKQAGAAGGSWIERGLLRAKCNKASALLSPAHRGIVHLLTAAVACAVGRPVALSLCRPKLVSPRARASVYLPHSASQNRFVCPLFIMKMQSHYAQLEYLSCCCCCCCCCSC